MSGAQLRHTLRPLLPAALLGFAALVAVAAFLLRSASSTPAGHVRASLTASAQEPPIAPRDFVRIVRVTGTTEATRSRVILAPQLVGSTRGNMIVTGIAAPGAVVKTGDIVVEFDRQEQETAALDRRAEYLDLVEQIAKSRAAQEAARVKDQSELEQAVNAVKSLELESLKNEMLSRLDAQANEQKLEAARVRERGLRENLPRKREAAAAELRMLEIRRDRARLAMEQAERNAQAMVIRSPMDGLAVARMKWKNNGPGDVVAGDDVWPGLAVLEVVNADSMRVRARVNQADVRDVRAGQPVTVRLDAYPERPLVGRVEHVAPLGTGGYFSPRIRVFTMLVAIDGQAPGLVPDLTAAVDVEVERVPGALVVPVTAVRTTDGVPHVRVRTGSGVTDRRVALGSRDEIDVIVTEGLKPGDVVVR
jgi:HlyD family secretion protein